MKENRHSAIYHLAKRILNFGQQESKHSPEGSIKFLTKTGELVVIDKSQLKKMQKIKTASTDEIHHWIKTKKS